MLLSKKNTNPMNAPMTKTIGLINSLGMGGAERQMLLLHDTGLMSEIVTLEPGNAYDAREQHRVFFNKKKSFGTLGEFLAIPLYIFAMGRYCKKGDTVVSVLERSNVVNIVSQLFFRHGAVVILMTNPEKSYTGVKSFQKLFIRYLYPYASSVIVNAEGIARILSEKYGIDRKKITVIQNGIDAELVQTKMLEPVFDTDQSFFSADGYTCIAVGRLEKPKGYPQLIEAFQKVIAKLPTAKLIILGDGSMRTALEELIVKYSLQNNVHILGFRKNPFSYINKADIFILSSLWEGMPNVLSEALACGTPVIASDCESGPREVLAPDTDISFQTTVPEYATYGVLLPVFEENRAEIINNLWAETITLVLQNKKMRDAYREKGMIRVNDFSSDTFISNWKKVLDATGNEK